MPGDELDVSPDTRSEAELDALADSTNASRNSERPMSEAEAKAPEPQNKEAFEFVHNGKTVKATRDQIIKWAQQGYNYPQLVNKLKAEAQTERQKWEADKEKWEKDWGVYKQVDQFAKQNADWWNYIQSAYQNRGTGQPGQVPGAQDPRVAQLEQKLSQFEPVVNQLQTLVTQAQERDEDNKLEQEIQSIRESHKDLDWNTLDENGKSLELRVLEHAQNNGIPTFKAAFRDLLHEDLLNRAQANAKLAVAKGIQAKTKLGVLGESPTSKFSPARSNKDIRNTSYEELENEIREELKSGRLGR